MLKRLFSVALFFMSCIGTMWASSNRGLLPTPFYNSVGSIQKVESAQAGDFTELKQVVNECRDWATTATTGFAPNAVAELLDKVTLAEMEIASARASQKVIDGSLLVQTMVLFIQEALYLRETSIAQSSCLQMAMSE